LPPERLRLAGHGHGFSTTDYWNQQLRINTTKADCETSGQSGVDGVPYAVAIPLGWAVTYWFRGNNAKPHHTVETLGVVKLSNPTRSIEDKRALALMERTTVKIEGEDAYVSGLQWRDEEPSLPTNYDMAKRRLTSLEKKLKNNPEMRDRYAKSIQDDVEKGYVKRLTKEEAQNGSDYLTDLSSISRNSIVSEECTTHLRNSWVKV